MKQELEKVERRARVSERRLNEMRTTHRACHEREASSTLVNDIQEKMRTVADAMKKLEDIFAPFLMGVEQSEDTKGSVQAGDEAMKAVSKATSAARIAISMRLVEVKRFTAEAGQEAQRSLQEYQKELEASMKRAADL